LAVRTVAPSAELAEILDSAEVAALVSELDALRWTGRKGYGARALVGACLVKSLYAIPTWTRVTALIAEHAAIRTAQHLAREDIPALGVQHHHAHIAACMAEHSLPADQRVIGLAFDGTGYGTDGSIWGGEVLVADYKTFERAYHLNLVSLPGGDLAVQQPWRLALAWLHQLGISWKSDLPPVQAAGKEGLLAVARQLETRTNTPRTSSMGRLFDAVAALIGVRSDVTYEGQAAIELENLVDPEEHGCYTFAIAGETIDPWPVIRSVLSDWRNGVALSKIAARFHNGLADTALDICLLLRSREGNQNVALSGGVWQNMTLLAATRKRLESAGFNVYTHHQVPASDGGLALGQAAVAYHTLFGTVGAHGNAHYVGASSCAR